MVILSNHGHFIDNHFTLLISCPLYSFVVLCLDEHRNMKGFWPFNLPFMSQDSCPTTFNARQLSHQVIDTCLLFIGCACEVFLSFPRALIFVFLFRKIARQFLTMWINSYDLLSLWEFDRHYDHARPNWTLCDDFTPFETFIVYLVLLVGLSMASFFLEIFFSCVW